MADLGNGGPREWRTPGMADLGNGGPKPPSYSAALLEVSALVVALKTYHLYTGAAKHFTVKTDHLSM
jgi:hypothetical protein